MLRFDQNNGSNSPAIGWCRMLEWLHLSVTTRLGTGVFNLCLIPDACVPRMSRLSVSQRGDTTVGSRKLSHAVHRPSMRVRSQHDFGTSWAKLCTNRPESQTSMQVHHQCGTVIPTKLAISLARSQSMMFINAVLIITIIEDRGEGHNR